MGVTSASVFRIIVIHKAYYEVMLGPIMLAYVMSSMLRVLGMVFGLFGTLVIDASSNAARTVTSARNASGGMQDSSVRPVRALHGSTRRTEK